MHWLTNAAERAGWKANHPPDISPRTQLPEVWRAVAAAYQVSEQKLAEQVAKQFKLGVATPDDLGLAEEKATRLVPEKLARKHNILPLVETYNELVVATSDPTDYDAEQAIGFTSGRRPVFHVAPPAELEMALNEKYAPERAMESLLQTVDAVEMDAVRVVEDESPDVVATADAEAAPVIKLTNLIIHSAVTSGASDIHIEPARNGGVVRFRVDGVLRQYMQMPLAALNRVVSRIKILGKLDIADRMRPQDGRSRVQINKKNFDLRISTVPTRDSEKAVIRILDPDTAKRLEDLGMPAHEFERTRHLLTNREGIFIVTGPTGSGKTTTLYGAIKDLAKGAVNIMTVEDPVEYELGGITQIQVETKREVTFASALRAILRQDPDVIFVGEIRDIETAQVALQASMTGHFVLATLHTNDAVGVVQRLTDHG